MILELSDMNHFIAPEVWTFDCSFRAPLLVLLDLLQIVLDLTLIVLAEMWNNLNNLVGESVSPIFEHGSSACWTCGHVHAAVLTSNVSHWTCGNGDDPGDQETNWTLELL